MDPIQDAELAAIMNDICRHLAEIFEPCGCTLLVFDYGPKPDRRLNYISTARREDMIAAMKEMIEVLESEEAEEASRARPQ